jgi:hypothetical protein
VTLGAQFASGRAQPYLGAGYSHLAPRFDVNYITASGQLDDSRVESNLDRATLFGGFLFHLAPAWSITGQFYTALKDAATVSFTLRAAL